MSNARDNTILNTWVLQIQVTNQEIIQIENARNAINFTSKPLQIDVTINMIFENQQLIKCIFELLFMIGNTSL